MTLGYEDGVHWLSPDAKKKCFYDERGDLYFFTTLFLSRLSNPVLIFTSYYKHTVVAVGLTTIWFETASVIRKKNLSRFNLFSSKDDTAIYRLLLKCSHAGVVFVDYFLDGGCVVVITYSLVQWLKGGFINITFYACCFFFLEKWFPRAPFVLYLCLECGVGFKVDYKPFGP